MAAMTASASVLHPCIDVGVVRSALAATEGIRSVILAVDDQGREALWVVLDTHDVDRDRRITESLLDVDVEVHLVPARNQRMVPDGRSVL